jgi:hypothetical protein
LTGVRGRGILGSSRWHPAPDEAFASMHSGY